MMDQKKFHEQFDPVDSLWDVRSALLEQRHRMRELKMDDLDRPETLEVYEWNDTILKDVNMILRYFDPQETDLQHSNTDLFEDQP